MTKDELVEKAKAEVIEMMGPIFGSPEYLADPVKLARAEKHREDTASAYVNRILAIAMPAAFEMAAKVADKRAEDRFADFGTTEWDTNASYYSGRRGEALNELDEEDAEIAQAIRAEGEKWK